MAEKIPADVISSLVFEACHSRAYVHDLGKEDVAVKLVEKSYIQFHCFDHDDGLNLGTVILAQGLPENLGLQLPPNGHATFDMVQAALPEGAISKEQVRARLQHMADEDIYPRLPFSWPVTVAGEPTSAPHLYLKRVCLSDCLDLLDDDHHHKGEEDEEEEEENDGWPRDGALSQLRNEAQVLQRIAQHPQHPNIIKYHGCRVRRGFVTAIVMDRANGPTLQAHVDKGANIDKTRFMAAMRSAVRHLHSVIGVAHNDINPNNIMVVDELPVLVDFGSCRPLGDVMGGSRGTPGWDLHSLLNGGVFDPMADQFSESTCFH